MAMTVGIDLGTTNSVVCVKRLSVTTLLNAENDELTPSCVSAVPKGEADFELVVGKAALYLMKQYPEQTVTSVKRLMGREFDDLEVQKMIKERRFTYPVHEDSMEPGGIIIPLGGKERSPAEISSLILKKLLADASRGALVDSAVVTVPAYFSDRQKFATRAACDLAGVHLLRLLPEPTAAAISFGLGEDKDSTKTIMVFDLGGGTFDISILNVSQGTFLEVAKGGNMWLGGENVDHLLVDHIYKTVEKTENCGPVKELVENMPTADRARFIAELKEKCEQAKIRLSGEESAQIDLFGILRDGSGRFVDIDVTLTRPEFDQLIAPLVTKLSELTGQLLREIRFEHQLIDTVLMVGGSSLIPAIQEEVKRQFGAEKVLVHPRPMTAVAEGAAWMAAHLAGARAGDTTTDRTTDTTVSENLMMMHSVAHDYYLQLSGGQKHLLVARNSPLPASVQHRFRFAADDQMLARLRVCNDVDGVMETVGELWFHADLETLSGSRREELTLNFSVDEDNIISMEAVSVTNPQRKVNAQIARGGLVTSLYADLERTLSEIVAS